MNEGDNDEDEKERRLSIMNWGSDGAYLVGCFYPEDIAFSQELLSFGKRSVWMSFSHGTWGETMDVENRPCILRQPRDLPQHPQGRELQTEANLASEHCEWHCLGAMLGGRFKMREGVLTPTVWNQCGCVICEPAKACKL